MFDGKGRRYWLIVMALGNLVLWVAIAAAVGLLVSDQVDLGVETELRQVQATAMAAWRGLSQRELALPGRATPPASNPFPSPPSLATAQPNPTSSVAGPETDPAGAEEPTTAGTTSGGEATESKTAEATAAPASSAGNASQPGLAAPLPPRTEAAGDASAVGASQGTAQRAGRLSPEPTPMLLIRPLLLADPEFHDLAALNAEMARSAPGRVVQIRYQEAMLSQEIRTLCEKNPDLPFRNVQADLGRDQLILTGGTTFLGFQINARVSVSVTVRDCRPEMEIETITLAGIIAPKAVENRIEHLIAEAMTWYPADYPLCLEQIVVEDTRATIYGYRR